MADKFEKLSFTKDWNNASDFPTYETNEAQVRADMQLLHDEAKDFINEKLIPSIERLAVPGAGDMRQAVYDPTGKSRDIFEYVDQAAAGVKGFVSFAEGDEPKTRRAGTLYGLILADSRGAK